MGTCQSQEEQEVEKDKTCMRTGHFLLEKLYKKCEIKNNRKLKVSN